MAGLTGSAVAQATGGSDDVPRTRLTGEIELARIVDLACQRRGIEVRYDPNEFASARPITVRSTGAGLTADELWDLCQRALARNGLTTVLEPGESRLQVVRLADAKGVAQLELDGAPAPDAGYATVLLHVRHAPPADLVSAVKPLLSRTGGDIVRLGEGDMVLLSELTTRLDQALDVVALLDAERAEPVVESITPKYLRPSTLVQQVALALKSRETLVGRGLDGTLIPMLDDSAMLLVAPEHEVSIWTEFVARFDVPQETSVVTYRPERHGLDDVASLIEQTSRLDGPRGSGERWKVVQDTLTHALVVTATANEHDAIAALVARLDSQETGAATDMRRIRVRNRELSDLHDTLNALLDVGMVSQVGSSASGRSTAGERPALRDRTNSMSGGRSGGGTSAADPVLATGQAGLSRDRAGQRTGGLAARGTASTGVQVSGNDAITITTDPSTASLIVMGPPRMLDQIESLVAELDVREPQVMLEVLVLSLDERELLDLGVELEKVEISGSTIFNLQSLFNLTGGDASSTSSVANPAVTRGEGATGLILNPGDFSVVIRALQTISDGRTLVMPKVLVNNGELALLDSVRSEPVQSTNASNTVATTSFNGTVDAGTQITVTPQIAEGDHLLLQYDISLSAFVGESASPNLPPPQQKNTLQSVVTIPDGHTIVLGGLESRTSATGTTQVPGLSSLPVIGELFKSRSNTESISRFYVFIRPTILRHDGFEDLRWLSDRDRAAAEIEDDWPVVEPRVIR